MSVLNAKKRIAHLIMVHKSPRQLARLIGRLVHADADIYVHVDRKVDAESFIDYANQYPFYLIHNRHECNWGGFSLIEAIMSSVREIADNGTGYDFINLLSGQDYPLVTADALSDFFQSKPGWSFISYDSDEGSDWLINARKRYEKYHFTDFKFKGKYLLQRVLNTIMPPREFPLNGELYGGTNACWWTLSMDCAKFVLEKIETDKQLHRFLKLTWGADEFAIPTLMMNSSFKDRVVNNNFRYIDWSAGGARPKTLTQADAESLLRSGMLFARKFDIEVDAGILDMVDQYVDSNNT